MVKKNKKTRRMYIRLSEEEYRRIKKKAEGYPSLSAYIIDVALKGGGDRLKQMKIMEEWAAELREQQRLTANIAGNLNQAVHYANVCKKNGVTSMETLEEIAVLWTNWNAIASEIRRKNEDILMRLIKG